MLTKIDKMCVSVDTLNSVITLIQIEREKYANSHYTDYEKYASNYAPQDTPMEDDMKHTCELQAFKLATYDYIISVLSNILTRRGEKC